MEKKDKIFIAGHNGMVGSAIMRNLQSQGYENFVTRSFEELDLSRQDPVEKFFSQEKPDYVVLAAAKVGGIMANNIYRAEFIYENLMIQNNVIHSAWKNGVKKLLFLGSSCIYPKMAPQPLREDYLLTGPLEHTNEPYAIAKIAGIKMCENYYMQYGSEFISVMPTNLYGPNDSYNLEKSHVLPAMLRKMHLAKNLEDKNWEAIRSDLKRNPIEDIPWDVTQEEIKKGLNKYGIFSLADGEKLSVEVHLWGSGKVYREFLHVDDMADACIYILQNLPADKLYNELGHTHLNIGTGEDITIRELASLVKKTTGFQGNLKWDTTKPDGTPKKQLDVSLLQELRWKHKIALQEGIEMVYKSYLKG